jgi:3,4-dehydroadipyl-CoA semialdehyde dehydrogenase
MGALVNQAQLKAVREGLVHLMAQTTVLHDGAKAALVDADVLTSCCIGPTLLGTGSPAGSDAADRVHDTEVFGPVATLIAYRTQPESADISHALTLIRRGQGSLVTSVYGSDPAALADAALELADSNGRVHIVSPDVAASQTGHGNVMPQSMHGGPGRAGGGEELGGARALNFYHRRSALQASMAVLSLLGSSND